MLLRNPFANVGHHDKTHGTGDTQHHDDDVDIHIRLKLHQIVGVNAESCRTERRHGVKHSRPHRLGCALQQKVRTEQHKTK